MRPAGGACTFFRNRSGRRSIGRIMNQRTARPTLAFLATGVACALATTACARWAREPRFGSLTRDDRPFSFRHNIELIEVSNGLRVALIHDDRTNLATVDVRYDVGSAEDPIGKGGLAHLVEHVLFELRAEAGGPTLGEELGELALHNNAFTSWDYTHYTSTVPVEHLDRVIALEARRMRAPCTELDDAVFARERDVVLAEGRQRHSPLLDTMFDVLGEVYGTQHPYARPITSEEVATATRDDVCRFVEAHYAPDRAYMVVTGPFKPAEIKGLIGRSFGPISRQASAARVPVPTPKLDGATTRRSAPLVRPQALVFLSHPAWGAPGAVNYLLGRDALAAALSTADDEHGWITDTSVSLMGGSRAPTLVATVEVDAAGRLGDAADEVFARAGKLLEGASGRSLSPVLGAMTMSYVESWDDLPTRGRWIADFMQFTDHNWFMLKEMRAINATNWAVAIRQLRSTFSPGRSHVVLLTPSDAATGTRDTSIPSGSHDLSPWRAPADPAAADRPIEVDQRTLTAHVEEYELANGLRVQLAPDPDSPIIDARLVFPVGQAHEAPDRPYVATAAARLLSSDTEGFYERAIVEKLEWSMSHGTLTGSDVNETSTTFWVRGMAPWGDWHVWYLSWLLDQGRYNADELDALHRRARSRGKDEDEIDPVALAFASRLFGEGHPYAVPDAPRGVAYSRIGAKDLERWKRAHYRARGATLIISGAFDDVAMKREIDELFGPWSGEAPADLPMIPAAHPARGPSWLAADDAGAAQTTLVFGFATASDPDRDEAARAVVGEMVEDALRDVREAMGASYGVHARYLSGAAGGLLMIKGDIDETKAGAVLARILTTLEAVRAGGDDQRAAFVRARRKALANAMGRTGGAIAIADELAGQAAAGHSLSHGNIVATQISSLKLADVARVAAADLADVRRVVLVRGKKASVDAAYAAINVTPERPAPEVEAKVDGGGDASAEPGPRDRPSTDQPPAPRPADTRPHRLEDGPRLSVGMPAGAAASTQTGLFLGATKISLDEFLRLAGADDVLRRMNGRRWARRGLIATGAIGVAIGATIKLTVEDCSGIRPTDDREECDARVSSRRNKAMVAVGLGLILAAGGSQVWNGDPDDAELNRIAARYNRVVAGGTGEGDDDGATEPAVVLTPVVSEGGGGLVLSGRF